MHRKFHRPFIEGVAQIWLFISWSIVYYISGGIIFYCLDFWTFDGSMVLLDLYYQFISFVYLLKIVGMYLNIVAGILLYLYRCIVGICFDRDWTLVSFLFFWTFLVNSEYTSCVPTKCNFVLERWNEINFFPRKKK